MELRIMAKTPASFWSELYHCHTPQLIRVDTLDLNKNLADNAYNGHFDVYVILTAKKLSY